MDDSERMIRQGVAKKVLGGAVSALELALGAARHVAWYVAYQVDGRAREAEREPKK
jgi:hypothetical protein